MRRLFASSTRRREAQKMTLGNVFLLPPLDADCITKKVLGHAWNEGPSSSHAEEKERKRINDYGHICTSYLQTVHEKFCVERQSRHFILIYNPAQDRRVNTFSIERSRNPRKGILVGERLFPLNWSWIWEINFRVKMFYVVGKMPRTCAENILPEGIALRSLCPSNNNHH